MQVNNFLHKAFNDLNIGRLVDDLVHSRVPCLVIWALVGVAGASNNHGLNHLDLVVERPDEGCALVPIHHRHCAVCHYQAILRHRIVCPVQLFHFIYGFNTVWGQVNAAWDQLLVVALLRKGQLKNSLEASQIESFVVHKQDSSFVPSLKVNFGYS